MSAMAALGFDPDDFDESDNTIEVWDCNAEAVNVFVCMDTQRRYTFAGAAGLDYAALPVVMDMLEVEGERRPEVFSYIRIMEQVALEAAAEHRNDG